MCRNIKTLFNFNPPATDEEVRAASLQFVRKLLGIHGAVEGQRSGLHTRPSTRSAAWRGAWSIRSRRHASPKNREEEAAKARARAAERFA